MIDMSNKISKFHLIFVAILLQSFSFVAIKAASMSILPYSMILIGLAFFLMFARALVWQVILRCNNLSQVYPFNALVQVIILLFSYFLFHEKITINNILGVILMLFGIMLLGRNE